MAPSITSQTHARMIHENATHQIHEATRTLSAAEIIDITATQVRRLVRALHYAAPESDVFYQTENFLKQLGILPYKQVFVHADPLRPPEQFTSENVKQVLRIEDIESAISTIDGVDTDTPSTNTR